ncbi:hypothetical protein Thein_0780 [Thermodesulfatator indicus DSM 15286]|uniref:Uncharacterized protein n=1 Tax=Thermodesulfatator indicus (strain DSM 15286 / JCM 11887 / CIR29812) TaxID=667014 RepID=F8ACF7_THEID|nr:hypothetical protein Thein_0780 [Thermodesulfatator indicus DSM 15286]
MERLLFSKLFDRKISRPSLCLNSIRDVSAYGNCPYTRLNLEGPPYQQSLFYLKERRIEDL